MKNPSKEKQTAGILFLLLIIPVVWAALAVAPFLSEGLAGIVRGLSVAVNAPLSVKWCDNSIKTIFIFLEVSIVFHKLKANLFEHFDGRSVGFLDLHKILLQL